ncbi:hypothetical protein BSPA111_07910 [Buttiauxella sp. A111]|nr:hypothetical protein BSPA111_07910 [Buttiauxella sp. A111]
MRKVWRQLKREDVTVDWCTIERIMKAMKIHVVTRGKGVRATRGSRTETPQDRVSCQFVVKRPDLLWVADFTYVST